MKNFENSKLIRGFGLYLSDVVCKQLRVIFLFLRGQIRGEELDGHLGGPLGEIQAYAFTQAKTIGAKKNWTKKIGEIICHKTK